MTWQNSVSKFISDSKEKIVELNLDSKSVKYSDKLKKYRDINKITGDEEIVRAFLLTRLINELGYDAQKIQLEKEYPTGRGKASNNARIDVILRDNKGNAFLFIECKSPSKFEDDKKYIKTQLFELAKLDTNVRYLVYYTIEETDKGLRDKLILIDREKISEYEDWISEGEPSDANELPSHYGNAKKTPLIKGGTRDLTKKFEPNKLKSLATDLHNVLWGGGGTGDSEVFASLVNLILAKIQDEYDRTENEEYHFQIIQHGDNIESKTQLFERINNLYRKALEEQLNITENLDQQFVINQQKFTLNKLVYTVQKLEEYSFVDGKSTIDGKDILGDFFEQIQRKGFKQDKGQFFTPINIVRFLFYAMELDELALHKLNEQGTLPYIIDPSCGSGTFLIESMKLVTKELKYHRRKEVKSSRNVQMKFNSFFMQDEQENQWARTYLYAIEHNFDLGTATKVNMILHGDGSTNVFVKDGLLPFRFYQKAEPNALNQHDENSIYKHKETNSQFDAIISNPPFSVNLDTEAKNRLNSTFVFHTKKNSENLFIERYFQLLKADGRLGVVLPESVFDTTENKYIRLFLYKYFWIRAVISLPQLAFEPYTSTKTSLLLAQRKTDKEIEEWNKLWSTHSSSFNTLKTRAVNYIKVYLEGADKKKLPSIKDHEKEEIRNTLSKFLRITLTDEEQTLEIKDLIEKYQAEIEETAKTDKDTIDLFDQVNTSWVFREVAKEIRLPIFLAEAENIGYKRTIRGEKWQPNDLFDIEIAPDSIDSEKVNDLYDGIIADFEKRIADLDEELAKGIKDQTKIAINRNKFKHLKAKLEETQNEKARVNDALSKYYDADGNLLEQYKTRFEDELINVFQLENMERFQSDYVLIRQTDHKTILENLRKGKVWR